MSNEVGNTYCRCEVAGQGKLFPKLSSFTWRDTSAVTAVMVPFCLHNWIQMLLRMPLFLNKLSCVTDSLTKDLLVLTLKSTQILCRWILIEQNFLDRMSHQRILYLVLYPKD
jgi:hypothetical protein